MNRLLARTARSWVTFGLLAGLVAAGCSALIAGQEPPQFSPPQLLAASDIPYPINSGASGIVTVAIYLDSAGKVTGTDTLRDIPSLTAPVLLAIPQWTFKPAVFDGNPIDSAIVASIAFNPADYRLGGKNAPPLGKELKVLAPDANGFLPPKAVSAPWAAYPINSVAQGSVVLDARIDLTGRVTAVVAAWRNPSLTGPSMQAAKEWSFRPARLNREPAVADAIIGYVFRPPNIASPVANP